MGLSYPPSDTTAWSRYRLRLLAAVALAALGSFGSLALARGAPIKVLVAASVADEALGTISPAAWSKYVTGSLAYYRVVPFPGEGEPTIDDCRRAGAEYMVLETFERRPQLPGLGGAIDRTAARAHRRVRDCVTGDGAVDDVVDFESDPIASGESGGETSPDAAWEREIPAALTKHPIVLVRPAHVVFLNSPFARVSFRGATLRPGDAVQDIGYAKSGRRAQPIILTVTQTFEDYIEVHFDPTGPRPSLGDLVER